MPTARKEKRSFDKLRTSGDANIIVLKEVADAMVAAAYGTHPHEACGILLGEGCVVARLQETRNVHSSPDSHFELDPQALIDAHREAREGGAQILGYFHSHPKGPAEPSKTDQEQAAGDGMLWAIWGNGDLAFWRDEPSGFREVSYTAYDS